MLQGPPADLDYVLRCAQHWAADPFPKRRATMTLDQAAAYTDDRMTVLMEGGNQSGKSRTAVLKCVGYALEDHPDCKPGHDVNIWYCTTTYDKFAEQAWRHFKESLLWPNESCAKLPTQRVQSINWLGKSPEKPSYIAIRRPSGAVAHVYIHTYAQGRSEFQGQTIDFAVVDEECTEEIFTEIWARTLASPSAKLCIACTPIEGEEWLDRVRKAAEEDPTHAKLYRFRTIDNPTVSRVAVEEMQRMFKDVPEELELRLLGIPRLGSALVYGERVFTDKHLIDYAHVNLNPQHYTFHRCIDAGFRHPACVWIAVREDEKQIVVYRTWKGKDLMIADAAEQILKLSEGEEYGWDLIDPAVLQRSPETGQPEINIWIKNGICAAPAPDNKVRSGIERVWQLMSDRIEICQKDGTIGEIPRLRVIRETCQEFLDERRKYRIQDIVKEPDKDAKDFRPVKQNDHVMDPFRYLVSAGLYYRASSSMMPAKESPARIWFDQRHKKDKITRRK